MLVSPFYQYISTNRLTNDIANISSNWSYIPPVDIHHMAQVNFRALGVNIPQPRL